MKHTTETFIKKARSVHGDKYDYSKVNYINCEEKIIIICPKHGEFEQKPCVHLQKHGCPLCCNNRKSVIEQFIQKARLIHGDKYDYSKSKYINNKTKITIICPKHGEFEQLTTDHLYGHGCPKCGRINSINGTIKFYGRTTENFISDAIKIHSNRYDYSKVDYKNAKTRIKIICPDHGEFEQTPNNHLMGHGCPSCSSILRIIKNTSSTEDFISTASNIHNNKYDYSKTEYTKSKNKMIIICPVHGEFIQSAKNHLKGHGCPRCNESRGEREIAKWLDEHDIRYEREKEFKSLIGVNGGNLRFDFYLPDHNICIEFDGEQHRKWIPSVHTKQQFFDLQEHDRRKNEFCKENGICLIRINHLSLVLNNLENILGNK